MNDNKNEEKRIQKILNENFEIQTFSRNFTALRESKGLTKKQMADLLSISPTTVSAYEAGDKSPSLSTAATIARICNVSLDWLCGISSAKVDRDEVTYRQIIECLIKLSELTDIEINSIPTSDPYSERYVGQILIFDSVITEFIEEWQKVKRLYDDKTIDSSLYDPWISKKLSDYDRLPVDWQCDNE